MFVLAGFDLSYSWEQASELVREGGDGEFLEQWAMEGSGPLCSKLSELHRSCPLKDMRVWFSVLESLYGQGAPVREALLGMASHLRRSHLQDFESHCRDLPTKVNIWMVLFFLPPTFLLVLVPLLLQLGLEF